MENTFTRTITLTGAVVSQGAPLDEETLRALKAESIQRLQAEIGALVDQKFSSGTLSNLNGADSISLDWKIEVRDMHPNLKGSPDSQY